MVGRLQTVEKDFSKKQLVTIALCSLKFSVEGWLAMAQRSGHKKYFQNFFDSKSKPTLGSSNRLFSKKNHP